MFTLESNNACVVLASGRKRLRIAFVNESIARITVTEGREFQTKASLIVTAPANFTHYELHDGSEA